MSLKKNILANYASQFYVTLIGILMVPLYIKYMGAEAYGLVGFFGMLQALFNILDMGLTPTIARETARFRGGATDALSYRSLIRVLEWVFLSVALVGGSVIFALSGFIAQDWLQVSKLSELEVQIAVKLMSIIFAIRLMCGLFRGSISGSERVVWLCGFNSTIATFRFIGVLPLLLFIGVTPTIFFGFQLLVAVMELGVLLLYAYYLFPAIPKGEQLSWNWAQLKPTLKFSLTIATTTSVWVLVTQTDKLVLSKILPLAEYGYFTLAVLVASSIMMVGGPISGAVIPRLTRLKAAGDEEGVIALYRKITQLTAITTTSAASILAMFSEQVLWAWTGDVALAAKASSVLTLYAIGNGFLTITALQYYLQFANGDLRYHLIGNGFFIFIIIPSGIMATVKFGMLGAAWVWLISNGLMFFLWVPLVHLKFIKDMHRAWLVWDVGVISLLAIVATIFLASTSTWPQNQLGVALQLVLFGLMTLIVASIGSGWAREWVRSLWYEFKIR
jgi:O-antigen/teichoic acid export membrane protein